MTLLEILERRLEKERQRQRLKHRESESFGVRLLDDFKISSAKKRSRNVSKLPKSPKQALACDANPYLPSSSSDLSFDGKY